MKQNKSTVAILRCESYESNQIFNTLKKGFDLLGGINKFIDKDDRILIKPNLLSGKKPDKQVTSHPTVFEGIIKILSHHNYLEYKKLEWHIVIADAFSFCGLGSPAIIWQIYACHQFHCPIHRRFCNHSKDETTWQALVLGLYQGSK